MYFERNLESNKLEIHTGGKSVWMSLPHDVRDTIKRYCNWSRTAEAWVSKGIDPWWADKLPSWGFEDRGNIGEKLTLEERIEAKQNRAGERAGRCEERADRAEQESAQLHRQSHAIIDNIPMGQPILVGHHSEARHRRDIDRSWNLLGKAVGASEKATYYERRAETAARTASGAQLKDPRYLGNRISEREADIRTYERRLGGKYYHYDSPGSHEVSEEQRERYQEKLDELRAELAFFQKCLTECGLTVYSKSSLSGMTHILSRYGWLEIIRLNPKSVSCVNTFYPSEESNRRWPTKVEYTEIRDAKRVDGKSN